MSRAPWLSVVGLLSIACNDYGFSGEPKPEEPAETSSDTRPDRPPRDTSPPEETGRETEPTGCAPEVPLAEPLTPETCEFEVETGTFTPVVEWYKPTFGLSPSSSQVMMTPVVASITDDNADGVINAADTPDIILITYAWGTTDGTLRAVKGDGGADIFAVGGDLQGQGMVAAADIDGDGVVELLAPTPSALRAYEHDGTLKWQSGNLSSHFNGTCDAPSVTDMDGDGVPEIVIGRAILRPDGSLRAAGTAGKGGPAGAVGTASIAVDIDGDGVQEVVVGNALYRPDGSAIWSNGRADGYVAVGNFDADPAGEIVVSGSARVRLQDDDGAVLWDVAIPGASSSFGGPPTIADYDGDGAPEVGVAANSSYTVFDTNGSLLWQKPTTDGSSGITGSSVFDFEGDGVAEAIYADETRLWVFAGPDGSVKLNSSDHSNATWIEYPTVADIDGDGHAEVVVPNTAYLTSYTGITVIGDADDSWREGRRIWNQHAYHITNINDDGTVPLVADRNWLSYNNFRSGDLQAADGTNAPDLIVEIVEVCRFECGDDRMPVVLRIGNRGSADVLIPINVDLYGVTPTGDVLLTSVEFMTAPGGYWTDGMLVDLSGTAALGVTDIYAWVDGAPTPEGLFRECLEDNNRDDWGEDVCP